MTDKLHDTKEQGPYLIGPPLRDGYEWVSTPLTHFGRYQKPIGSKLATIDSKVTEFDKDAIDAIESIIRRTVTAILEEYGFHRVSKPEIDESGK